LLKENEEAEEVSTTKVAEIEEAFEKKQKKCDDLRRDMSAAVEEGKRKLVNLDRSIAHLSREIKRLERPNHCIIPELSWRVKKKREECKIAKEKIEQQKNMIKRLKGATQDAAKYKDAKYQKDAEAGRSALQVAVENSKKIWVEGKKIWDELQKANSTIAELKTLLLAALNATDNNDANRQVDQVRAAIFSGQQPIIPTPAPAVNMPPSSPDTPMSDPGVWDDKSKVDKPTGNFPYSGPGVPPSPPVDAPLGPSAGWNSNSRDGPRRGGGGRPLRTPGYGGIDPRILKPFRAVGPDGRPAGQNDGGRALKGPQGGMGGSPLGDNGNGNSTSGGAT